MKRTTSGYRDAHKVRNCRDCKKACAVGGRNAICQDCKRLRTDKRREFVCQYLLEHPCVDCGESNIVVLDFDHIEDKNRDISAMVNGTYAIISIQREMDKCEVVCSNCHRLRTASRANQYRWRFMQCYA